MKRYCLEIPDKNYYKKTFNCYYACPVNTKAGNYVSAIADGEFEKAYEIASLPNPFVNICARVCGHPCETTCRRGRIDKPVSIRALKRFATEKHNSTILKKVKKESKNNSDKKIAVVGGGPSGLSAAYYLANMGYKVTIFEKNPEPGGMLYRGLPIYRLPRDIVKKEIDKILSLGIELQTNCSIGKDFSISDLKSKGFDSIYLSIGADTGRMLNIPGNDLDGVINGIDYLINFNMGYKVDIGKKVIVIGGGNIAIDVARSVIRGIDDIENMSMDEMKETLYSARSVFSKLEQHDRRKYPRKDELRVALDVARSIMRTDKNADIKMICLESKNEMPAHEVEINEASLEGITVMPSLGPQKIHGHNGKVTGLETIDVKSVFDEKGRFNPSYFEGTNKIIEADTIILAIGLASDLSFIQPEDDINVTRKGTILVGRNTLSTTASGVFAGGDVAFGPRLLIDAVGDGKKAAISIDNYINKKKVLKDSKIEMKILKSHEMADKYDTIARHEPPTLPLDRRVGITEVELAYSEKIAKDEGNRCLKCDVNTIFDSNKCILCGGCVDVCPQYCLKLVNINQVYSEDENLSKLLKKVFGKSIEEMRANPSDSQDLGTLIIKDEENCIRCALCVERCPNKAITMEQFVI